MSNTIHYQSMQEIEAFCMPQFQALDHLQYYIKTEPYSTLESSSASGSLTIYNNSPSTLSFSPNESSMSQQESHTYQSDPRHSANNHSSPVSGSRVTNDVIGLRHKLKELETAMLGPDSDALDSYDEINLLGKISSPERESWKMMMGEIPRWDLKQLLMACAKSVSNNDMLTAQYLISELRQMVSVSGEPIQRLGAYMLEGLVAKHTSSGSSICKALKCKEPASDELLSYMHLLYEVCPYFKFGYMSANGAIAEAMKDENRVHIIDFRISQGSQWVPLIQAFAARPGGPPHIRITGIDDSMSAYARGGGVHLVGQRLSRLAKSVKVPFEFHAATISTSDIQLEHLSIRPGEALAVNFAFVLHHMPDESVSTQNHRDRLLRLIKSVDPKVVTLVEQESNTNTAAFYPRFVEALDYYTAMFGSIGATISREHKERINVEQHCLARDLVNIIACEGNERVVRHELMGKWKSRFRMAGFEPYPLSSLVNSTIKRLLENYSDRYRLEERDGALYLGWMKRDLVASCAWK